MRSLLVLALLFWASAARAGDDLVFASDPTYPPFATLDGRGEIAGLDRDIAEAMCRVLGATCRFERRGWNEMIAGLADGRFDAGFSGISTGTAAMLGLPTTQSYLALASRFAGRAGEPAPHALDDLSGYTVGALWGTAEALWLEARLPAARVMRYPDEEEMYLSLQTDRIDLVFGDGLKLERDLLQGPLGDGLALVGPAVDLSGGHDGGLVFLAASQEIAQRLDGALAALAKDGTLARLREKYLPDY
jgi:ABC-type amino acid transport substrate-binding protein